MSGFFTEGEIGNTLAEAEGTALIPSTTGEVLGAQFRQTFVENPASRLWRLIDRNTEPYPITMQPEEANAEYGVPGRLTFTEPVSRTTARDLNEFHVNSAIREDVIARRAGGFATSGVARFAAGLPAAIIDPLNIASAFIPGVREARVAALLGETAAGVGGRLLVRGIAGGSAGLVGAAALEPLNYWLAQQDRDDYTMGDVLTNLAFGTILGAGLHSGIGVVRDRRGLLPAWSPEMHEASLRHATAAIAEGRPVEAAAAMEFTAIRAAREELTTWASSVTRVAKEAEDAITVTDSPAAARTAAAARLADLRAEIDSLRADAAEARSRMPAADTVTEARIAEIDRELGETIPSTRRADLERERTMLTEGRDFGEDTLNAERTQAEITGLERAAAAKAREAGLVSAQLANAEKRLTKAESILSARSAALTSREAMVQELAARTLRRLAGRLGVELPPEEALDAASRIIRSKPDALRGTLDDILNDLSKRVPYGPYLPGETTISPGTALLARMDERLAAREAAAETKLRDGLRGTPDPRDVAADRDAALMRETAPKVEGNVVDDIVEAERSTKEIADLMEASDRTLALSWAREQIGGGPGRAATQEQRAAYMRELEAKAKEWKSADAAELAAADELAKEGEGLGRAFEAAAACAIGGRR